MKLLSKILCKIFGHKPINNIIGPEFNNGELVSEAYCKRCNIDLFGWYTLGDFSHKWFWAYVPANVKLTRCKAILRSNKIDDILN